MNDSTTTFDDFLWDCAFINENKDRLWIIPDEEDFHLNEQEEIYQEYLVISTKYDISCKWNGGHMVKVTEKRLNNGVLDIIGGEVWEASLLLSSFLILNSSKFLDGSNILELGSGVGLPSFLLTNMKLAHQLTTSLDSPSMITITDYESSLLKNLSSTIEMNYNCTEVNDEEDVDFKFHLSNDCNSLNGNVSHRSIGSLLQMNVCSLDWTKFQPILPLAFCFSDQEFDNCSPAISTEQFGIFHPDHPVLQCDNYDYVIGSALCYASFHAKALFNSICYYLKGKRMKEIIICQIGDREGFSVLLELLSKNGIAHKIDKRICDDIIQYAQRIYCRKSQDPILCKHGQVETSLFLEYFFPSPLLDSIPSEAKYGKMNLIKSSIDSFCFLHVFKN
jgi:hypothetical protein